MTVQLGFPRQPFLELYLTGEWQNVITDVRQTTPIKLERARKSEQSKPTPSELTFVLDDSADHGDGNYSPRNPMGDYYPDFGRNVPVRFGYELAEDNFNRVSSSGWQGEWINGRSSGGVVADTDWTVTGTVARHIVPNQNQFRGSTYDGIRLRNAEQRYTWTRPALNVTGGVYTTIAQFRIQDPTFTTLTYCYVEFYVDTSENLNCTAVEVINGSGTIKGTAVTLIAASPQTVNICCNLEGNTFRVKAWDPADPEPLEWQHTMVGIDTVQAPGEMGIISRVDTANTNADPHTFEYENWSARAIRFTGETSTVVPEMDLSENIRICKVECGTLFRRHEQGDSPVQSALRRFISNKVDAFDLFGYWPCEDERFTTTTIASGIENGPVMLIGGGLDPNSIYGGGLGTGLNTTKFAENDDLAASAPLPVTNSATWRAYLTDFTALGRYDVRWYMSGTGGNEIAVWAIEIFTWGSSANRWLINLADFADGTLRGYIQVYDLNGNILVDDNSPSLYPDVAKKPAMWYLQLAQNGANIDYNLSYLSVGAAGAVTYIAGTLNNRTLHRIVSVGMISGGAGFPDPGTRVVGHISIGNLQVSSSNYVDALSAFAGESATERLERLAEENSLPVIGQTTSDTDSAAMGPQQVETLLDLLVECADTDHGFFFDSRSANSYSYIPLGTLYGRDAHVTLDNSAKHLGEGFAPTDDDATTVNDVTVKAKRGSSARQQATTGPLNTGDPGTGIGAVGRYDKSFTVNPLSDDQLRQSAGWILHLGTTDESRFPEISVDLAADAFVADLDLTASILDLDVGDVIGIANLENWFVFDEPKQIVLGYTEIMQDQYQHSISFNTAPYSPYNVGSLGDHEIRLDSSDSFLDTDIDSTDTIFDVSTPDTLTRWILSTATDKILTGYYSALTGTTTTVDLNSAAVAEMNIGDQFNLHNSIGVLKEATTFTITNITDTGAIATVTFTPAAAVAIVTTDRIRSWYSDNFNFDIMVGGERMTVTNISLTEPQQFTVTRSVNGVIKPHLAGTKVELFKPYWLAK